MKRSLQFFVYSGIILVPAAVMTYLITAEKQIECEVCMDYRSRSQCRKALGPSREECQRTATNNACAFLASGMTESLQCDSTPPKSVSFK